MYWATHLEALDSEAGSMLSAARRGLDASVPGCPGWDVERLVAHTGQIHRYCEVIVRGRPMEEARVARHQAPPEGERILDWFGDGLGSLRDTLGGVGPDAEVWSWAGGRRPAAFWARRMALETVVHRWDTEQAHAVERPVDAALAVDGIDELFDEFIAQGRGGELSGAGETLHLHATDADGEWLCRFTADGPVVTREHAKGHCAVRAPASDLFLLLWGRRDAAGLEVFGDEAALRLFTDRVNI